MALRSSINYLTTILIILFIVLLVTEVNAKTYIYSNGMRVDASSTKEAARKCFFTLTNGKYPGEEKGMEIIDVCANGRVVNGR